MLEEILNIAYLSFSISVIKQQRTQMELSKAKLMHAPCTEKHLQKAVFGK